MIVNQLDDVNAHSLRVDVRCENAPLGCNISALSEVHVFISSKPVSTAANPSVEVCSVALLCIYACLSVLFVL